MAEDILQRLLAASDPAEKAALVARFALTHEEPVLAELVPVLAFLRWFDEPVAAALLPEGERPRSAELYARLIELPFVERVSYGYALHDLTRQGLLAEANAAQRRLAARGADVYAQNDDFESQLESLYCAALAEESDAMPARLEQNLYAAANRNDWNGLLALFDAILEAETLVGHEVLTRTPLHWFAKGLARQNLGDLAGAVADYDRAIALNPQDAAAYYNRGSARSDLGDLAGAVADFDQAIQFFPDGKDKAAIYINRGAARYALGEHLAAIQDYDRAIQLDPEYALAYINRGAARYALGEHLAAIQDYDRAIQLDPEDAITWYNRGNARRAQGDLAGAVADYDQAIALNPQYATAYYNRGNARRDLGDLAGAVADYDQAIALNPADAAAYNNRGIARRAQGDLAGAVADYDQAIALFPDGNDKATAYNNRGSARAELGDLAGAVADYDQAIDLFPDGTDKARAYRGKAMALRQLARYDEAAAVYRQALAIEPGSLIAWMALAELARRLGDSQKLQAAVEKARPLLDEEKDVYNAACFYSIAGEVEQALALLAKAVQKEPGRWEQWAKQDPDLSWIRDDPRFWEVVGGKGIGDWVVW